MVHKQRRRIFYNGAKRVEIIIINKKNKRTSYINYNTLFYLAHWTVTCYSACKCLLLHLEPKQQHAPPMVSFHLMIKFFSISITLDKI